MFRKILMVALMAMFVSSPAFAVKKSGGAKKSGAMHVQVREVIVKAQPEYMAASAGTLNYGAEVSVVGESGNWSQIATPSGWVPKSAITAHKVKMDADAKFSKGTTAKGDEVALAGKGFNPQVEAQYKKDNANLVHAYAEVDRVETFGASEAELKNFASAGKLR